MRLYGWYGKRIGSGRYWPVKPEAMVLDAEKIYTSCFRVWKTEAAKSIWRLTGWPLRLLNVNGRFWPAGAEKECAGGRETLGSGPLAGQTGNKIPPAGKCAPRLFAPEKFALAFFVCQLNFVLLLSAAGAASPGKTKQKR